jgi:beta-glucanase (GH16 family)
MTAKRKYPHLHGTCFLLSFLLLIATGCNGNSKKASADTNVVTPAKTTYSKLIWSDEFNADGTPDTTKWGYDIGTGTWGWGNNEKQYYTSRQQNAVAANGVLRINAVKEKYQGSDYTSARLVTKNRFSFRYGKIEVLAKIPAGIGTWPAIWMLGDNNSTAGWPACGEIDIMEHKGKEPNRIYSSLHHPNHSGANANGGTMDIANATTEFHKYVMEWSADSIIFYVDEKVVYSFANSSSLPFNHHFHILLNVAIGGNFTGAVDPALTHATMEVDYVRVYQ